MTCKLVKKDGYNAFQCSNTGMREMTYEEITGRKSRLHPYRDNECEHNNTFEHKGVLKCQDCNCVYDDNYLEWVSNANN